MQNINYQKGMTLLEMFVVIAIIGIIAVIAFPSYEKYVEKTALAAAKNELVDMVAQINVYKMKNSSKYSVAGIRAIANDRNNFESMKGKYQFDVAFTDTNISSYRIFLLPQRSAFTKSLYITAAGKVFECANVNAAHSGNGCKQIN